MVRNKMLSAGTYLTMITIICLSSPLYCHGADKYWVGGSGSWNNGDNWSLTLDGAGGSGQPQGGDSVYLIQSDGASRDIYYSNTPYPGAVFKFLQMGGRTLSGPWSTINFWMDSGAGNQMLSTDDELIARGSNQRVTFNQSGGTHSVTNELIMGSWAGGSAKYHLSGTGILQVGSERIGGYDTVFTQSGGLHRVAGHLWMGTEADATYVLSGGVLEARFVQVGAEPRTSLFSQTGGIHRVKESLSLYCGRYSLSGTGILLARYVDVGGNPGSTLVSSAFDQSGGSLVVGDVRVNAGSSFTQSGGTHTVSGTLTLENHFDHQGNPIPWVRGTYDLRGGTLVAATLVNKGALNYSGGALAAAIHNSATLNLSGTGTRVVAGPVTNNQGGVLSVAGTTGVLTGAFVNHGTIATNSASLYFKDILIVGQTGVIQASPGDTFFIETDFTNNSIQNALWNTNDANVNLLGFGTHQFSLAGSDMGATLDGYTNNFAWKTLDVEGNLSLVDGNGTPGGASYFDQIIGLHFSGTTVTNIYSQEGLNIYYLASLDENGYLNGQTYDLTGGGELIPVGPVPIPGTVLLFAPALLGILGLRKRLLK